MNIPNASEKIRFNSFLWMQLKIKITFSHSFSVIDWIWRGVHFSLLILFVAFSIYSFFLLDYICQFTFTEKENVNDLDRKRKEMRWSNEWTPTRTQALIFHNKSKSILNTPLRKCNYMIVDFNWKFSQLKNESKKIK